MCQASWATFLKRWVQSWPRRVKILHRLVGQVDLDPVAVELDFVNPSLAGRHLLDRGRQGRLDEAGQRRLDADGRGFSYAETPLKNSTQQRFKLAQFESFRNP